MSLSIVSAMTKDGIIGIENELPWGQSFKEDLKRFKKITMGELYGGYPCVIMGRKTFDSLSRKPLKGRTNIVLTKSIVRAYDTPNIHSIEKVVYVNSVSSMLDYLDIEYIPSAFVIGGSSIYKQLLPYCNKMYLTVIDQPYSGNVRFPDYTTSEWEVVHKEPFVSGLFSGSFINLERSEL